MLLSAAILACCAPTAERIDAIAGLFVDGLVALPGDLMVILKEGEKETTYVVPDACLSTFAESVNLVLTADEMEAAAREEASLTTGSQAALCYAALLEAAQEKRFKVDDMTITIQPTEEGA